MNLAALLGTALPIIQAPMAGSQGAALALAVSEAGACGSLPCAMLSADAIERELTALAKGARSPVNLNFFCHPNPAPDAQREQAWRVALSPYYRELGVDPGAAASAPPRVPFSAETAALIAPFRPQIVSFHFGLPSGDLLAQVKSWGAKVLSTATTVAEARWLEAHGVDAIIAQGLEAGGHRGMFLSSDITTQVGTFALLPQIVAAVRVPVIAAGGIADAKGVAAAMRLGAQGVQVGTAYLLCPEATTSALHRQALASDAVHHTVLTNLFSGRPARGIVNRLIRELGPMSDLAPAFPQATQAVAPLRAKAESQGSADFSPLWAGQSASLCRARSAKELTAALSEGL